MNFTTVSFGQFLHGTALDEVFCSTEYRSNPAEVFFEKISQNSKENTSVGVSFLGKMQACKHCNFNKKETPQEFSCEFYNVFKSTYYIEHFWWLFFRIAFSSEHLCGNTFNFLKFRGS